MVMPHVVVELVFAPLQWVLHAAHVVLEILIALETAQALMILAMALLLAELAVPG